MVDCVPNIALTIFLFSFRLPVPSHNLGELALDARSILALHMYIRQRVFGGKGGCGCGVRWFNLACVLADHETYLIEILAVKSDILQKVVICQVLYTFKMLGFKGVAGGVKI